MAKPIYVDVSKMHVAPQARQYKDTIPKVMSQAAARAFESDSKRRFTTKTKSSQGFRLEITLKSVIGKATRRCSFNGVISTLPRGQIITKALTGSGDATGSASVADVADAVVEDLVKNKVIPVLASYK